MQRTSLSECVIQEGVLRSWWVFLFALVSYAGYEVVATRQQRVREDLESRRVVLQAQLTAEEAHHENLRLQLASQDDPAWVELTLMRCLGVVQEEQTKVYIYEPPSP